MTATDPRPELAAALLERLAPAAEALAAACAGDIDAGPPPEDDRARADYHRAARAGLAHLRQLLAVLDWSARHLPEPEPEPEELHYLGEVWTGKPDTPEFYAWIERLDRRAARERKRRKKEKRRRKREKQALAAQAGVNGRGDEDGGEEQGAAAGLHDETMTHHDMPRRSGGGPAGRPAHADARAQPGAHYARAGEAPPATGASGTADRQGGRNALQTTGAETGPMTKHDTS